MDCTGRLALFALFVLVCYMCNVAPLWLLAGVLTFLQIGVLGILGFLTDETHAHQQTLSGLKGKVLKGKVDNSLPALTSKVDEMGTKISKIPSGMQRLTDMVSASTTKEVSALSNTEDEMCTTMQAKISSISCQMDCISGFTSSFWCATQRLEQLLTGLTQEIRANQSNFETKVITVLEVLEKETRGDRVGDPFSASSGGYSTLVTLLTELRQEMKGSGPDQSKIETKLDLCLAQQMAGFQSQVDQLKQLMSSMGEKIQNLPHLDPHAVSEASSISSAASIGSWTHVTGKPCCYLADTYFKVVTADGEILSPAKMLFKGAQVVAANGTPVEVVQPPEQHRVDAVIELQADHSSLVVSPDHRILIPGNKTVQAMELEVGSEVILDGTQAKLTSMDWKLEPTMVLKISFRPDLPVAAFMRPPSILSKGSRKRQFRRGKKRGDGGDVVTIPDTEGYLTD